MEPWLLSNANRKSGFLVPNLLSAFHICDRKYSSAVLGVSWSTFPPKWWNVEKYKSISGRKSNLMADCDFLFAFDSITYAVECEQKMTLSEFIVILISQIFIQIFTVFASVST